MFCPIIQDELTSSTLAWCSRIENIEINICFIWSNLARMPETRAMPPSTTSSRTTSTCSSCRLAPPSRSATPSTSDSTSLCPSVPAQSQGTPAPPAPSTLTTTHSGSAQTRRTNRSGSQRTLFIEILAKDFLHSLNEVTGQLHDSLNYNLTVTNGGTFPR